MNKNILKLSIILILVYSFTLPFFVHACYYTVQPEVELRAQFFELFFTILFFLTIIFGIFFKLLKVRFSTIKRKKMALLGIVALLAITSYGGVYVWFYVNYFITFFYAFFIILFFLVIIFGLFFKFFKAQFSIIKHKKLALLGIVALFIIMSFIGAYFWLADTEIRELFLVTLLFFVVIFTSFLKVYNIQFPTIKYKKIVLFSIVSLVMAILLFGVCFLVAVMYASDFWVFRLSYIIFSLSTLLFIKFFKARLSVIKYKKIILLSIIVLLNITSLAVVYLLSFFVGLII